MSRVVTSQQCGFARNAGESLYPHLWHGLSQWFCPGLHVRGGLTIFDLSNFRANATLQNMTTNDWVISHGYGALDFDGSNDQIKQSIPAHLLDVFNTNIFSVSLWCFVRSFANSPVLWTLNTTATNNDSALLEFNSTGSHLYVKSANQASGPTGARTYTLSTSASVNRWHHICFIKDGIGDNGRLFFNGVQQTSYSGTMQSTVVASGMRNHFGAYGEMSNFAPLDGLLDDMRIYSRSLSSAECRLLSSTRGIGLGLSPRRRRYRQDASQTFNPAWAHGSNQLITPGVL